MLIFNNLSLAEDGLGLLQDGLNILNNYYNKIVTVLTTSPENLYSSVWSAMKNINGYLTAIGVVLVVIFFYIGLTKQVIRLEELRRPANFFGAFIRLALAEAIVMNSSTLLLKVMEILQGCISGVANLFGGFGSSSGRFMAIPSQLFTLAGDVNWGTGLLICILALLGTVIIWGLSLIMLVTVYVRFFKIYIYAAISPLPLATFGGENSERTGRNFLMSFIGVGLQGLIIAIAFIIFSKMTSSGFTVDSSASATSNMFNYLGTLLLQLILLVTMVRASDRIIKEMVGG